MASDAEHADVTHHLMVRGTVILPENIQHSTIQEPNIVSH